MGVHFFILFFKTKEGKTMDRYKTLVRKLIVMTGLSIVLSAPVIAQDVILRGNIVSVDGNYDSAGVNNAGSLNINGNMNVSGPFTNKSGGSVHATMGLNISGSTLTATNAGTLTAGSYWSDGHFSIVEERSHPSAL